MTTELRFNLSEAELEHIESYLKEKHQMTHFKDCCNCQGTRSDRICSDGCKRARKVLESLKALDSITEQDQKLGRYYSEDLLKTNIVPNFPDTVRPEDIVAFKQKGVDSIEQED